ncbi:uncharacterized protein LOC132551011 [Ylistrum balloti]|uniref:uncharacterized protein LOC132551011 n=1 Tax=Ylistrum balloti TaxID=509963 RepID=UPI002905E896|nr:uncharacterized protein LOC132551011 [Ylistrum balloti]
MERTCATGVYTCERVDAFLSKSVSYLQSDSTTMPTPSWPNPDAIGPHGFSFPSSFQDSFHKPVRIDEVEENPQTNETSVENRLDRLRKGSALTINIPQSSGYDIYEENSKYFKKDSFEMDIDDQQNRDNNLQERKQFLDTPDGNDEKNRRKKRKKNKWCRSKCLKITLALIGGVVLLFCVIFAAFYFATRAATSNTAGSVDITTNSDPVEIVTTRKPQIISNVTPSSDPSIPVVAIKMVVDEDYVENGKGHLVLWRIPRGKHINEGITYNNGSFKVPVDGYYTFTSTLMLDTRHIDDDVQSGTEIRVRHCVHINQTQDRTCTENGIPVGAIRSDIVQASWVHIRAGQEVYITISQIGFISDTSDSNTFTMSLISKSKETR